MITQRVLAGGHATARRKERADAGRSRRGVMMSGVAAVIQDAALSGVGRARQGRIEAGQAEVRAMAIARRERVTWEKIAGALGVAQPNAIRKYGAAVKALLAQGDVGE